MCDFIAQLLTEPCLCCPWRWVLMTDCRPWKEWECCIQRRWRCLHNTLSFTLYGLCCSLPFSHFVCYFFLSSFLHILSLAACPPSVLCLCPCTSLSLPSILCKSCHLLKSVRLFYLSLLHISAVISPTTFYRHLPFPHSADLSPWHLSNSPCTHSAVPLIACSFTLPFLLSWLSLPWQSDNCWSIHC